MQQYHTQRLNLLMSCDQTWVRACMLPAGVTVFGGLASAAAATGMPQLEVTLPFVIQNAQAVAGIGMGVLGAGLVVMILLSLLGNYGLQEDSADGAYAPAAVAVEVRAHRQKVSPLGDPGQHACVCSTVSTCTMLSVSSIQSASLPMFSTQDSSKCISTLTVRLARGGPCCFPGSSV